MLIVSFRSAVLSNPQTEDTSDLWDFLLRFFLLFAVSQIREAGGKETVSSLTLTLIYPHKETISVVRIINIRKPLYCKA